MARKLNAICSMLLLAVVRQSTAQTPLSSEFTYQGRLTASGLPALTTADFQFLLFDAVTEGGQIGAIIAKDNVAMVDGVFTVSLDYGPAAFSGNARWLQIAVRSPAGQGGFTTLAPRQSITATPNATYSSSTRGITVDNNGNVGVGMTPSPQAFSRLNVAGHVAVTQGGGFFALNGAGTNAVSGIQSSSTNGNLDFFAGTFGAMHLDSNGSMGIKENDPAATLHVKTFGFLNFPHEPLLILEGTRTASVQFFPHSMSEPQTSGEIGFSDPEDSTHLYIRNADPAGKIAFTGAEGKRYPSTGKEDLRIIRGRVDPIGEVVYGSGFSVTRLQEGVYRIEFSTSFDSFPVATANSISVGFSSTYIEFTDVTANSITLQIVRRSDGNLVDGRFYFIALGPRG